MRHPILRILASFFLAFFSPVCCCQAAEWIGDSCLNGSERRSDVAAADRFDEGEACARGCCGGKRAAAADADRVADLATDAESSDERGTRPNEPCTSCAACQSSGASLGSGLSAEVKVADMHADLLGLVVVAAVWGEVAIPVFPVFAQPEREHQTSACVMSGRSVLRWHCALMV